MSSMRRFLILGLALCGSLSTRFQFSYIWLFSLLSCLNYQTSFLHAGWPLTFYVLAAIHQTKQLQAKDSEILACLLIIMGAFIIWEYLMDSVCWQRQMTCWKTLVRCSRFKKRSIMSSRSVLYSTSLLIYRFNFWRELPNKTSLWALSHSGNTLQVQAMMWTVPWRQKFKGLMGRFWCMIWLLSSFKMNDSKSNL